MKVYLLKISTLRGNTVYKTYHEVAYTDPQTAQLKAEDLQGDYVTYTPEEATAEELDSDRVAVGRLIFDLCRYTPADVHQERGLAKLTGEEIEALLPTPDEPYETLKHLQNHPSLKLSWDSGRFVWSVVSSGRELAIDTSPLAAVEAAIEEIDVAEF